MNKKILWLVSCFLLLSSISSLAFAENNYDVNEKHISSNMVFPFKNRGCKDEKPKKENPCVPEQPSKQETPSVPEQPSKQETPSVPEQPSTPEQPSKPVVPNKQEKPNEEEKPDKELGSNKK